MDLLHEILQRISVIETKMDTVSKRQDDMVEIQDSLVALANKSRGALFTAFAVGGIVAWIMDKVYAVVSTLVRHS